MIKFQDPWFFLFLPLVVFLVYYYKRRSNAPGFGFSSAEIIKGLKPGLKLRLRKNLFVLRPAALVFLLFALARPQSPLEESKIQREGIDIVLALDCSTSMLAEDFKIGAKRYNRLEVVKDVVEDFIQRRSDDRIALVAFASRAYTLAPLTLDYGWLVQNLKRVNIGIIEDGTAIGSAVSSALNRLKDTPAKSKVVILLTDGRNNAGKISPLIAAETAKALKVKVYTIGAGTKGPAPYPMQNVFGETVYQQVNIDIDEDTLTWIASLTDARYFRATDTKSLREIYEEIDKLEKTPVEEKGYLEYKELFGRFLIFALAFLCLEILLSNTVLRVIP